MQKRLLRIVIRLSIFLLGRHLFAYDHLQLILHLLLLYIQYIAVRQILFMYVLMFRPRFLQRLIPPLPRRRQLRFNGFVLFMEDKLAVLVEKLHLNLLSSSDLNFNSFGHLLLMCLGNIHFHREPTLTVVDIVEIVALLVPISI